MKLKGQMGDRYIVTCNGRPLPFAATGNWGEAVAGVRYRAWWPPSALHPTVPPHVPLTFDVPGIGRLRFRLSAEPFLRDSRFRILYYFPADPATMQQCAAWSVVQEMEQRD